MEGSTILSNTHIYAHCLQRSGQVSLAARPGAPWRPTPAVRIPPRRRPGPINQETSNETNKHRETNKQASKQKIHQHRPQTAKNQADDCTPAPPPRHPAVNLAKTHPAPQTACPLAPCRQSRKQMRACRHQARASTPNCMSPGTPTVNFASTRPRPAPPPPPLPQLHPHKHPKLHAP